MSESEIAKPLTGWQRAHVLSAAEYLRERAARTPGDKRARAVYEGLLEVLEPTRHVARQYREQHDPATIGGSMWDQRSGRDRRVSDRRMMDTPPAAGGERRGAQRRSGRDRRTARG